MLRLTNLTGFSGGGYPPGPRGAFYSGRHEATSVTTHTANFDIGTPYSDRLVVVAIVTYSGTPADSVTVNGKSSQLIGGIDQGGGTEWYICVAPPGQGTVSISASHGTTESSVMIVWVITGGCGTSPVAEFVNGYGNNTNSASAWFNAAGPLNAFVFAVGIKLNANGVTGISSSLTPENDQIVGDTHDSFGYGFAWYGPNTTARTAGNVSISSSGNDSSKPQVIQGILIQPV
jgi:hypothetical protein